MKHSTSLNNLDQSGEPFLLFVGKRLHSGSELTTRWQRAFTGTILTLVATIVLVSLCAFASGRLGW